MRGFKRSPRDRGKPPPVTPTTTISRETTILAEEDMAFAEAVMFWSTPTQYGSLVNPTEEAKRIRGNQALGRPITEGEVPTIERKHEALLEGIFN